MPLWLLRRRGTSIYLLQEGSVGRMGGMFTFIVKTPLSCKNAKSKQSGRRALRSGEDVKLPRAFRITCRLSRRSSARARQDAPAKSADKSVDGAIVFIDGLWTACC